MVREGGNSTPGVYRMAVAAVGVELRRCWQACCRNATAVSWRRAAAVAVGRVLALVTPAGTRRSDLIRRARCTSCRVTHALLPDFLFNRRLDEASIIGQVLALSVCLECRATRPVDAFVARPDGGVYPRCRECRNRRARERYHSSEAIRAAEIARSLR